MNRKKTSTIILILLVLAGIYIFIKETKVYEISSFSTSLLERTPAERQNIAAALDKINGRIVKPGGIFSFNEVVGKREVSSGFQEARSIEMGNLSNYLGGGICQLSSTLYQAVLLAGLPVIERHPHPVAPRSVSPGLDATVSFGSKDLRFKNNLSSSVKLEGVIKGKRLVVKLFSQDKPCEKIYLFTKKKKSGNFLEVEAYRCRQKPDEEEFIELISRDKYQQ